MRERYREKGRWKVENKTNKKNFFLRKIYFKNQYKLLKISAEMEMWGER
jgi:hypothetical protein